ncbi:MAG: NAD(P)H-binding protein [bacterium]|jgi:uncharacterized protein YbjT (DUF2867 family)
MALVIGGTGFVGRELVARLSESGTPVRVMARHLGQADAILGHIRDIEIVKGDLLEPGSIIRAIGAEDVVIYLASALASPATDRPATELDQRMMTNLCRALNVPNPPLIVYLGPLCDRSKTIPPGMVARMHVEAILKESGLPNCIFRTAPILGRWGMFFRLMHAAASRLRIIWMMRSATTPCQPIYVGDVVSYLAEACVKENLSGREFEIAGNDVMSYQDMIELLISVLGYSRLVIPVPFDFTKSAAAFLSRCTGIPLQAVTAFMESMSVPILQLDKSVQSEFPSIHALGYLDSIHLILKEL